MAWFLDLPVSVLIPGFAFSCDFILLQITIVHISLASFLDVLSFEVDGFSSIVCLGDVLLYFYGVWLIYP